MGGTVPLFARWEVNRYTLTYHGNGAGVTGLPETVTRNAESSVMVSLGSEMRRDGHIFSGWNTVQNPTETNPGVWYGFEFGQNRNITLTGNVTLFAQWRVGSADLGKSGTLARGFEGSAAFIVHVAVGGQLVIDRNGNVGIIGSFNPGLGSPSAAIGGTVTATTARNIKHLEYAETYTVGASGAIGPVTVGVDYIIGHYKRTEPHYWIHGGMAFVGISSPWPEGHGTVSYSGVVELNWLPDFAKVWISSTVISGLVALPAPVRNVLNEIWEGG
jgi:hypothetical protein